MRDYGGARRVAGLRREELARLAGVSIAHYTRLEQGKGDVVSDEVLTAVAAALRLDADESTYLHRIARRPETCANKDGTARAEVPLSVRHLLHSFVLTPALVVGRHTQLLAWNPLAAAVFGDFANVPDERRTLSHLLFTEPSQRDLYGDGWGAAAREHVAHLRVLFARFRGDPAFVAHVESLRALSADFARLWDEHPVAQTRSRAYDLHHPVVGDLTLHAELVSLPDAPSCCALDLFAAEPGTPSARALRELAGL
ncbi:DNA-binding XRE family transcriptional regulator [Actinomadura rupiterrae]|nr:DNA-binding XRE family transcriptional regulator [Actinomadura rupiterrae]